MAFQCGAAWTTFFQLMFQCSLQYSLGRPVESHCTLGQPIIWYFWDHCHIEVKVLNACWRHQMKTFSALLALCAGNSPVLVNSAHNGQWRGALMFSLICAWINDWANNREAGDLRRHRGHYNVIVMGAPYPGPVRIQLPKRRIVILLFTVLQGTILLTWIITVSMDK